MPNYKKKIRRAARRYGVRPELLISQLNAESGLRMGVRSPAGAEDIAQFTPATAARYGVTLGDGRAADDIMGAAHLMHDLLKQFGGDERKALAAYNAGPGAVQKYGGVPPYKETQAYVQRVLAGASAPGAPGAQGGPGARYVTQTQPTPGVDNSAARDQLKRDYFFGGGDHQPGALIALKQGLDAAQDTPGYTTTSTRKISRSVHDPAANDAVAVMKAAAEKIDQAHVPYQWGGGHSGRQKRFGPVTALDCSGAVSRVLGIDPLVSGQLAQWGKPGKGKRITIFANGTHTLMEIDGHVFGTSAQNPGGGAGWVPRSYFPKGYFKNFVARHPPGM